MRQIAYEAFTTDEQLLALVPKERWLENSATLDIPESPFVVLAWGETIGTRGMSGRMLRINVHDSRGDYSTIDAVLARATDVILGIIDVTQGDSRFTEATWEGASGDLDDPQYRTNLRYAEFRIAGR